jgi:hypothetical protein
MEFEGSHEGGLHNKVLQKYENALLHMVQFRSYWNNVFSTQISQELLIVTLLLVMALAIMKEYTR